MSTHIDFWAGLRKENDKLGKMAQEGSRKVKELGNVQNWAEMLERDFLVLGEWVRLVDGGSESGSESVSSWTDSEGEEGDQHGQGNETNSVPTEASETDKAEPSHTVVGDMGKGKSTEPPGADERHTDADGDLQMQDTPHETQQEGKGKAADTDPLMVGIKMNGTPADPARELEVDHRMADQVADATAEVMHDDEVLAEASPNMNMDEVILHDNIHHGQLDAKSVGMDGGCDSGVMLLRTAPSTAIAEAHTTSSAVDIKQKRDLEKKEHGDLDGT